MPQGQKPPDLDRYGNPIGAPPDLDRYGNPIQEEKKGLVSRVWNAANEPITHAPSEKAREMTSRMDTPGDYSSGITFLKSLPYGLGDAYLALRGERAIPEAAGFQMGAIEGAGDLASSMTSPLNIAGLALGVGEVGAARAGLGSVARAANLANKAIGAGMAAGGTQKLISPSSTMTERLMAIPEIAGGVAAVAHPPAQVRARTPKPVPERPWQPVEPHGFTDRTIQLPLPGMEVTDIPKAATQGLFTNFQQNLPFPPREYPSPTRQARSRGKFVREQTPEDQLSLGIGPGGGPRYTEPSGQAGLGISPNIGRGYVGGDIYPGLNIERDIQAALKEPTTTKPPTATPISPTPPVAEAPPEPAPPVAGEKPPTVGAKTAEEIKARRAEGYVMKPGLYKTDPETGRRSFRMVRSDLANQSLEALQKFVDSEEGSFDIAGLRSGIRKLFGRGEPEIPTSEPEPSFMDEVRKNQQYDPRDQLSRWNQMQLGGEFDQPSGPHADVTDALAQGRASNFPRIKEFLADEEGSAPIPIDAYNYIKRQLEGVYRREPTNEEIIRMAARLHGYGDLNTDQFWSGYVFHPESRAIRDYTPSGLEIPDDVLSQYAPEELPIGEPPMAPEPTPQEQIDARNREMFNQPSRTFGQPPEPTSWTPRVAWLSDGVREYYTHTGDPAPTQSEINLAISDILQRNHGLDRPPDPNHIENLVHDITLSDILDELADRDRTDQVGWEPIPETSLPPRETSGIPPRQNTFDVTPTEATSSDVIPPNETPDEHQPILPGSEGYRYWTQRPLADIEEPFTSNLERTPEARANEVASLAENFKAANEAGHTDLARALRDRIKRIRRGDHWNRPLERGEEFLAKARRAREQGIDALAEHYENKANKEYAELAGQLRLEYARKKSGLSDMGIKMTPEQIDELQYYLDHVTTSGLSHEFAISTLADYNVDPNKAGLTHQYNSGMDDPARDRGHFSIVFRNEQGIPIAAASGGKRGGQGYTSILASNREAGAMYGRALKAIGQQLVDWGALKPEGSISKHTYNLLRKILNFAKDQTGSAPIPDIEALGEGWEKVKNATGWGKGYSSDIRPKRGEPSALEEAWRFPGAATTTGDLSALLRQGLGQIHTPEFWQALYPAAKSMTAEGFNKIDATLRSKPVFQDHVNAAGKTEPSIATQAGMKLFEPASKIGPHSEAVASKWLENGAFFGPEQLFGKKNPLRAAYNLGPGKVIRGTNRFFISFLNQIKANRFEYLMNRAENMSMKALNTGEAPMPGVMGGVHLPEWAGGGDIGFKQKYTGEQALDLNPYYNLDRAREIADFINTATGQGPLKGHLLPFKGASYNLEASSRALSNVFFSPGLLSSRIRMLNPSTYMMASPFVRKQYLKSMIGTVGAWYVMTSAAQQAANAMGIDSEIVWDPTNSDFGKFRIGNTRLDFGGGFLQFAVLLGRMMKGGYTSSSNPEQGMHTFGQGFQPETQLSNLQRFASNKLNPSAKFAWDWLDASENKPFHVTDRTAQMFISLFGQDFYETLMNNPELLPWITPAALLGAGTQTYGKYGDYIPGQTGTPGETKFVTPGGSLDWKITGGGPSDWFGMGGGNPEY